MRLLAAFLLMVCLLGAESIRVPAWTQPGRVLSSDGLVAKVGGQPARVLRLQGPGDDLMILLILDLVEDLNKINLAREALVRAISEAPPNAYIGVLRAQDGLKVLQDPTGDRDALAKAIRDFPVTGTPGLLETVESASGLADSILIDTPIRIALFYVTDSEIGAYREDFTNPVVNRSDRGDLSRRFPEGLVRDRISRLDAKLAGSEIPIFAVHLSYGTGRLEEAYQNGILQMSATTGGDAVFCRSDSEISGAIESMMSKIVAHYSLDLQAPAGINGTVEVSLESETAGDLVHRSRYHLASE